MAEKFGIKETKEMLHFLFGIAQVSIDSASKGKFGIEDLGKLFGPMTSLPQVINGITEIPKEISDLSTAEKQELYDMMEAELHIPHQLADLVLKKVWKIVLEFGDFLKLVKK